MLGLYLHIPFCSAKCDYCDFYSLKSTPKFMDSYLCAIKSALVSWGEKLRGKQIDTIYIGGGTPSYFGGERIWELLQSVHEHFVVEDDAEITCEANPLGVTEDFCRQIYAAGVDRVSLGMQSAVESELRSLGRDHLPGQTDSAVDLLRNSGIENISLDLIIGVPGQTEQSLAHSLQYAVSLEPTHLSAYLLKVEEDTPLYRRRDKFTFPDDDRMADFYLQTSEELTHAGYEHYEVSNFCLPGRQSRHNMKYWRCEEYLGIGPSAHSMVGDTRFFYPRDVGAFIDDPSESVLDDGMLVSNDYLMLSLRTRQGFLFSEYKNKFGKVLSEDAMIYAKKLQKEGYLRLTESGFSLTTQGFLLSNTIISSFMGKTY